MTDRQIVLDTETTGLEPSHGHRIIEIGAVELIDRSVTGRQFHYYINPEREVEAGALEVHGITNEFLEDKPLFADIVDEFLQFIEGAELVIHNAAFDVGFLDHELGLLETDPGKTADRASVLDTLALARDLHPGQRNSLDALCKRYMIDNTSRSLHGALLDAQILAEVYLAMTGGQTDLALSLERPREALSLTPETDFERPPLRVIRASEEELAAHEQRLDEIAEACGSAPLWRARTGEG